MVVVVLDEHVDVEVQVPDACVVYTYVEDTVVADVVQGGISHTTPWYPDGHVHEHVLPVCTHVPPFLHGK